MKLYTHLIQARTGVQKGFPLTFQYLQSFVKHIGVNPFL